MYLLNFYTLVSIASLNVLCFHQDLHWQMWRDCIRLEKRQGTKLWANKNFTKSMKILWSKHLQTNVSFFRRFINTSMGPENYWEKIKKQKIEIKTEILSKVSDTLTTIILLRRYLSYKTYEFKTIYHTEKGCK